MMEVVETIGDLRRMVQMGEVVLRRVWRNKDKIGKGDSQKGNLWTLCGGKK